MAWRNQGITGSNNIPLGKTRRFGGDLEAEEDENGFSNGGDRDNDRGRDLDRDRDHDLKRGRSPEPRKYIHAPSIFCFASASPCS